MPPAAVGAPTLVVGDVHGCLDELRDLLRAADGDRARHVVFVGDLVAKGPDSQGVVQLARELGASAVLGNHDARVLDVRDDADAARGASEHAAVARSLLPADRAWLEDLPLWLALGGGAPPAYLSVHGGLVPGTPLDEQAREWLLNLRSIRDDGTPSKRIEGHPWASRWPGPIHVLFGHDAIRGLQRHPFATGIDTGCVYGRQLTGMLLPERRLVSVPARRMYRSPKGQTVPV
jgi:hypothetical protein